ncbi:MAG: hypothetical protein U1A77_14995 [Pirellulales bacterium]
MPTSRNHWFLRGAMVGVLLAGALNAASYFARSEGGGNLLGNHPRQREAIGFPLEMWEAGNDFDGYYVDLGPFLLNIACGAAMGIAAGVFTLRFRPLLDSLEQDVERTLANAPRHPPQISLRGMLVATGLAALVAAAARYANEGRPEVLGAFYLLGPWLLVATAFLPLGLNWQQRVYVVIPVTFLLMAGGILVGRSLAPPLEFDKVLLGTFICWTPQAVLVAFGVTAWLFHDWLKHRGTTDF